MLAKLLSVVTIHIPMWYNPEDRRTRRPVERSIINTTLREAQSYFTGFSLLETRGWCRSENKGGTWDNHLRLEIDVYLTWERKRLLTRWKLRLEKRFQQDDIYVRISARHGGSEIASQTNEGWRVRHYAARSEAIVVCLCVDCRGFDDVALS
jgi:hypothetical protein